ncbi:hypothetical protein CCHL11_06377 [Colletotrichum chlorophyti]|uniref:Zn(2)-C6 fungal-type domain-containing protein n=1 Tax=Colletotrichum chlorophyti TaxID=708187 RepID=A0A1Q8RPX1_9PEZI|nr:hypothetical protein CCHL11_06377 [Colletotrichum chlorophyti]
MDPGQPDSKRPRLSTTGSWSPPGAQQHHLPPLHVPPSHPSTPHQAPHPPPHHHHTAPPGPPYQHAPPPPYPPRSTEPHHPPHPAQHHPDDRRHHDQEPPYTPIPEQYRPPPSPAHPSYHPYPPRDPGGVKREPHDENHSHPRRPHSTGGGPSDGLPPPHSAPPPPPAPHPPQPYPDDTRRHMNYENPPQQMPPTPGGYRSSFPPPQIPQQSHPPHYDQSPYQPPPHPESLYPVSYASTQKRKATRASQACDSCRQLKAKCDETKPCKSCREKGVECKYRETIPKATDKGSTDILEAIADLKNSVEASLEAQNQRMTRIEKRLDLYNVKLENGTAATEYPLIEKTVKSMSPVTGPVDSYPAQDEDVYEQSMPVGEPGMSNMRGADVEDDGLPEQPPGPPVPPGQPSIAPNHLSRVDNMLSWPGIKDLTQHILEREGIRFPDEYSIAQEKKRGLIRVYGRGEGSGQERDRSGGVTVERSTAADLYGTIDGADETYSETGSSPSPGDAWGFVGTLSPPTSVSYKSQTLTPEGHPDFSEETVKKYVASFEEHILSMHPIIAPVDLHGLVKRFLDTLALSERKPKPGGGLVAKFASSTQPDVTHKRKRSPASEQPEEPVQRKPGRPHRTIDNALVLVVLALGKVCLHQDKIPDLPSDFSDQPHTSSPMNRNGGYPSSPGSGQSPPPFASHHSSGLPSPKEQMNNVSSRRQSTQGSGFKAPPSLKRNYEVTPGLEYFAYATDILGNHVAGWTLKHAQALIFAGLYYGQLGRVLESFAMYSNAARALHMIMHRDLAHFLKADLGDTRRNNHVLLAYWSCLQLESDILAEIELPQSVGQQYDEGMAWPSMVLMENDFSSRVRGSYVGQLYLRKTLNSLHSSLYNPRNVNFPIENKLEFVKGLEETLRKMEWVSPDFFFKESDPPANNLLDARLRAKFWGARVIIYRPFIKFVLELTQKVQQQPDGAGTLDRKAISTMGVYSQDDASTLLRVDQSHGNARSPYDELSEDIASYAERGIAALVQSTKAFHGVDNKRLLVTNIFGTAHAQFGNLLILAAAYRDPYLKKFVKGSELRELFRRTILMLSKHAQATSTLATDMRVLQQLEKDLFDMRPNPNASFDSSTSTTSTTGHAPPPSPRTAAPNHQLPNNHERMAMSFINPSHSAHNSPSQGHRILSNGSSQGQHQGQYYQGQPHPMQM